MDGRMRFAGEDGVTLIESLVTVAIIGIAFAALLGGMFTSVLGSDHHRRQATAEGVLRSYAEAVKTATYANCATTSSYPIAPAIFAPPSGYTASITAVAYWNGPGGGPTPVAPTFGSTCTSDNGLQKITLTVAAGTRDIETIDVIKRRAT